AGFSSEIGARPYDRDALALEDLPKPAPIASAIRDGGANLQSAQAALGPVGTILLADSLTYDAVQSPWDVTDVLVQAERNQCPVVRLVGPEWVIRGNAGAKLSLEGLLITGTDIVLRGTFDTVTISCSTIDPGEEVDPSGNMPRTVDNRPLRPSTIWIEGMVSN